MLNPQVSMKTLTEFPALNVKLAHKTRADLKTSGKTDEEIPQALGEALKLSGERLDFMMSTLEIVGTQLNDLKRVVVFSINEKEKQPAKSVQKGDHFFLAEYYPPLAQKKGSVSGSKFGSPDEKKRKKRRRRKDRVQRFDKSQVPSPEISAEGATPAETSNLPENSENKNRLPKRHRSWRPRSEKPTPSIIKTPSGEVIFPKPRIIPVDQKNQNASQEANAPQTTPPNPENTTPSVEEQKPETS